MKEKKGYTIIHWPDSQLLYGVDWYDECEIVPGKHNVLNLGFQKFYIPNERLDDLQKEIERNEDGKQTEW